MSDLLIGLMCPAIDVFIEYVPRADCMENVQRLTLAMLLYQCEHGKLPDENWVEQIKPYLGEKAEQYFSCPANPSPKGETTYAMVRYGDTVAGSLETMLLIELKEPVPFDKAIVAVEEVLNRKRTGSQHSGGMNVGYRNGAVRFMSETIDEAELLRQLGRE
jgi:hypothetical protein